MRPIKRTKPNIGKQKISRQRVEYFAMPLSEYKTYFMPLARATGETPDEKNIPRRGIGVFSLNILSRSAIVILISFATVAASVRAGSITPSASPTSTAFTFSDLYTRLTTNATTSAGNHVFAPSASPTSTLQDLTALYNAIPTIDGTKVVSGTSYLGITGVYNVTNLATSAVATGTAYGANSALRGTLFGDTTASNVCATATYAGSLSPSSSTMATGTTICGTAGTLLGNLFEGSINTASSSATGGSQTNGGGDDYNNGSSTLNDRYTGAGWTLCISGNSYCGTNTTSSYIKDNSTGLIWSYICAGSGCTSLTATSSATFGTYTWDSSGASNGSKTAAELCASGTHGLSGWSLPHQKQYFQAIIDGAYGNLEAINTTYEYWSATTYSVTTSTAWEFGLARGFSFNANKAVVGGRTVRCVR